MPQNRRVDFCTHPNRRTEHVIKHKIIIDAGGGLVEDNRNTGGRHVASKSQTISYCVFRVVGGPLLPVGVCGFGAQDFR